MWSTEKNIQFINDFHASACLWDSRLTEYKIRRKRVEAMQIIADKFKITISDVEKKIHLLRTQFRREYNKTVESEKEGSLERLCGMVMK